VALRTAAAPSSANNPEGTPGQIHAQAWPSRAPSRAPTVEGRREQAAGRAAAHAHHGREGLQSQQCQKQKRRYLVGECKLRDVLAVAEQLRERDRDSTQHTQNQQRRSESAPTRGLTSISPGDRPNIADRYQACNRSSQDREDHTRHGAGICRNQVSGRIGQRDPRDGRGNHRSKKGWKHVPQCEHPAHNLHCEKRAAQGYPVGRGHSCSSATRHQKPALFIG
jgi:hypothetical protein